MVTKRWPVLKSYDRHHLGRIAMPLGGIGAGSISLGGHGELKDWELFNRPAKGFIPCSSDVGPCVLLYMKPAHSPAQIRVAEGPLEYDEYQGCVGSIRPNHGMPRFRECRFDAAYPLAQVHLRDRHCPLSVRLEAFSPVVPGDPDNSSLPIIQLRYVLRNRTEEEVKVAAVANLPNFVGMNPRSRRILENGKYVFQGASKNKNTFHRDQEIQGLYMFSRGVAKNSERWGTIALTTSAKEVVSYRTSWLDQKYMSPLVDFYNDLQADGRLDDREHRTTDVPTGSLAVHLTVPPRQQKEVIFYLTWHFPNRMDWTSGKNDECVGNWYAVQYKDAWDVARTVVPRMAELEAKTVKFVRAFCNSDLPLVIKETMLFNMANLFTETCHRLPDGTFCAYEGCGDNRGYCEGSCTHVWNYEQALPFLFGDLAKSMREVEYTIATGDRGDMVFRVMQPFEKRGRDFGKVAADGQLGCIMKMYRDWHLSGDDASLERLWPKIKRSLEYCWIKGGWDGDRDGVMEGCQHNTMDVEYFGPNPQVQIWYLGALRAAAAMAAYVNDADFERQCNELFERGSAWTDENLFNGEYYEHHFREQKETDLIPAEQRIFDDKPIGDAHQLLNACLIDQLVGQVMAHVCGLGYLVKLQNIRMTLRSIVKYNTRKGFYDHFNVMRSFALGDETALMMASYPRGNRPEFPFPYYTETMTGFEYTAAIGMLYEGQREKALECIANIRNRYDGLKRNPFDEAECGHHYVRAMASWAAGLAWTGFSYSAVNETMIVNGMDGRWFWSNGYSWGTYKIESDVMTLKVLFGELRLQKIVVGRRGEKKLGVRKPLQQGRVVRFSLSDTHRS